MISVRGLKTWTGYMVPGSTVAEAKKNLLDGLTKYARHNKSAPVWLKTKAYRITYKFDAESILNYYKGCLPMLPLNV